jgi:SAM-dependent methyltransferase
MIRENKTGSDVTVFSDSETGGLGPLTLRHPPGTFGPTPASRILLEAIAVHQNRLRGIGLDWGSGVGCLAILAARIGEVDKVYGLEISESNIAAAAGNAAENGVADKALFLLSDSYRPFREDDRRTLEVLRGKVGFIVSNPPSSDWDDGFGYRRLVLSGAREFLKKDGVVLLNISYQYGPARVGELAGMAGFQYEGVTAGTDWVPFDLTRPELLDCLQIYACEESRGGPAYAFGADGESGRAQNAREALTQYRRDGSSPLSKWQTHLFRFTD